MIDYPTVRMDDPDRPALSVLEVVLGGGKGCRLYRALVEGAAVASDVGVDNNPGRYPGWINVQVELLPGKNRAAVEKLVLKELAQVRTEAVSPAELKRAKQMILASTIFSRESTLGLAKSIGEAVTIDSLDAARKFLPRILEVTAADVQRVAKKYLDPEKSVTIWSIPPAMKTGARERLGPPGTNRSRKAGAEAGGFDLKKAQRVELENGLVLMLFENHRLPIFEAHVTLARGEPLSARRQARRGRLDGAVAGRGDGEANGEPDHLGHREHRRGHVAARRDQFASRAVARPQGGAGTAAGVPDAARFPEGRLHDGRGLGCWRRSTRARPYRGTRARQHSAPWFTARTPWAGRLRGRPRPCRN